MDFLFEFTNCHSTCFFRIDGCDSENTCFVLKNWGSRYLFNLAHKLKRLVLNGTEMREIEQLCEKIKQQTGYRRDSSRRSKQLKIEANNENRNEEKCKEEK